VKCEVDQLQLPVARNQNLECVYLGGNKNSIAGIAMQGTKFRITHKRISSRILIRQKSTLQDQFPKLLSGSTKSASDTCLYLSHAVLTNRRDNSEIKQDSPTFSSTLSITNIDKSEDADIIICIARASSKYPEQE
jgi:hypothetical protein